MFYVITCIALLAVATDFAQSTLTRLPKGLTVHKGSVMWDEAYEQCRREGGVIASPINEKVYKAMKSVIDASSTTYFIGTKATDIPGQFMSSEGITLENMPLSISLGMVKQLDQREGDCLVMNQDDIRTAPCWSKLPFMCYNAYEDALNISSNNCGPVGEGYKYDISTGHCYKLHTDSLSWEQAHWKCFEEGAYLAIIESEAEAQSIRSMDDWTHDIHIFIGRRMTGKSRWMSVHNQPVEELYNVVPGTRTATDSEFQCGGLHRSGKWQYVRCGAYAHFVCQKEPTF